jgi:hypothetical protein
VGIALRMLNNATRQVEICEIETILRSECHAA